ncbi:MAG TPA: extracellular solute-binding protein [Candidatus Hydrogenedentes bacterium]|nr:extracellular solute-binding protein [Candidatus Hydrogenedentota bacterium]
MNQDHSRAPDPILAAHKHNLGLLWKGFGKTFLFPKRKVSPILVFLFPLVSLYSSADDASTGIAGELVVFHAGSLSVPFAEIAEAFADEHPGVKVLREAAGSRACARKIVDLERPCDVFASADYSVIDELLIPDHADWNIKFASNEMAVAYTERSHRAEDFAAHNWHEILLEPDVAYGRSNPDADPCGYRTVLTLKLAERHHGVQGLAEHVLAKDTRFIRPKETDLLALLETGAVDYIFIYRSVAQQHRLKYLLLPDEVNLKKSDLADHYGTVTVQVSGKEPGTFITKTGAPMVYGVTIPKNGRNPAAATAFVAFLLDKNKGMAIMEKHGQPSLIPSPSDTFEKIPTPLRRFAREPATYENSP